MRPLPHLGEIPDQLIGSILTVQQLLDLSLAERFGPLKQRSALGDKGRSFRRQKSFQLLFLSHRNICSSGALLSEPGLTTLGDSGFCSWVVTCDPARLRRLFTLTGVVSSAGQSGRFTEGRDTGLGMDGERNRLRGRQWDTGCRTRTHRPF